MLQKIIVENKKRIFYILVYRVILLRSRGKRLINKNKSNILVEKQ
jgi:hypothetical protein